MHQNKSLSVEEDRSPIVNIASKIGLFIIYVLISMVALVSLLPVMLLPFITVVPLVYFVALAAIDATLLLLLFNRAELLVAKAAVITGLVIISVLAVVLSQWFATTPPILGTDGLPLPGSIAEMCKVELDGSEQWLTIRGHDTDNPVLLFLAGGPGGTQLAATRKVLGNLEKDFTVVNWEQPGAGKSYRATDFKTLTPQKYLADAHALTNYLIERFDQEKIYIVGESWGSILGVWMIQEHPELYHAFAGIAQMVAFLETDLYNYELALQITAERGDTGTQKTLLKQGPPPYYGKGTALKVSHYMMVLSQYMMSNPQITGPGYDTFGDIFAVEYGLYDKVNYFRGLLKVMENLWPQLWEVDLREQAHYLEVPVYFLLGRHDVNAPPYLVEEYMQVLETPYKELIWFEHSGHSPWVDESENVIDVLVNRVGSITNK